MIGYLEPCEPNDLGYQNYIAYGGDRLIIKVYDFAGKDWEDGVKEKDGRRYLPPDKNISILMTIASEHFKNAKTGLLEIIQE